MSCSWERAMEGAPGTVAPSASHGTRSSRPASHGVSTATGSSQAQRTTRRSSLAPKPRASSQQTAWTSSITAASVPHSLTSIQDIRAPCSRLTLCTQNEEAARLLGEVRESFRQSGRSLDLLRLQWTEGKVAFGLGRFQEAETLFRQVQTEFLSRGMGYDAALVSLDLAVLFALEHRTEDLKRLAAEVMQVFESRDVHREAVAALILFQNACEEERLTAELAGQIAAIVQREQRAK